VILRPYQQQAVERLRNELRAGHRCLLLVAPTGAGKTVIACEIVRSAVAKGKRVLFLAHRRELISQPSAKLTEIGIPHGIIMAGHAPKPALVQVASVQTIVRREVPASDLVIVDEAHHVRAQSYEAILAKCPGAVVLGLTATPWRTDGKGLGTAFDASVLVATPAELVAQRWLVPITGWAYDRPDLRQVAVTAGDYNAGELVLALGTAKIVGNVVARWQQHAQNLRTVVFACNVEHSKQLARQFQAAGVAAEHLDGETPIPDRDAILARLAAGTTKVVCNCQILTEGWDLPGLECVVLARPTLSTSLALQMIGRGRRPAPGKTVLRVHDHANVISTHGQPDEDRDWTLTADLHVSKREAAKRDALRTCRQCFAIYPSSEAACPLCHYVNPRRVRVPRGVDGQELALDQVKSRRAPPEVMQAYLTDLLKRARERNYKIAWVGIRFKARFGIWPWLPRRAA